MVSTIVASAIPQPRRSEYLLGGREAASPGILKTNDFGVVHGLIVDIALVGRRDGFDVVGRSLPISPGVMSWLIARLFRVQIKTITRDPTLEHARRAAERNQSRSSDRG
jgi:hypothetical protein